MAYAKTILLSTGSNDPGQISQSKTTQNVSNTVGNFSNNGNNVVLVAPGPALRGNNSVSSAVEAGANGAPVITIPDKYYAGGDGVHPSDAG
jgi:hypothetical protein